MVCFENFEIKVRGAAGNDLPEHEIAAAGMVGNRRVITHQSYVEGVANTTYSIFLSIPKNHTLSRNHSIIFDIYIDGVKRTSPVARLEELVQDHDDKTANPKASPKEPNNQWERIVDGVDIGNYKLDNQSVQRFKFGALMIHAGDDISRIDRSLSKAYHPDLGLIEVVVWQYNQTGALFNTGGQVHQGARSISETQIKGQAVDLSTMYEPPTKVKIPERQYVTGDRVGVPLMKAQFKYRSREVLKTMNFIKQEDESEPQDRDCAIKAEIEVRVKKEDLSGLYGVGKPEDGGKKRKLEDNSAQRFQDCGSKVKVETKRIKTEPDW